MMLPRRVPFIGDVPLPMISSCPRSVTSPTSTQTFEVPMSSATMYLSSVFGMVISYSIRDLNRYIELSGRRRHRELRVHRLDDDASVEAQIGVLQVAALELVGSGD